MKKFMIYVIIFLIIIGLVVMGINLYVKLSTQKQIIEAKEVSKLDGVDCIVVLGAGVWGDKPSPMLEDRLIQAIELYKNNVSSKIIMSGDHGRVEYDEVNIMKNFAIEKGVPSEDIFMDHAGFSSYDSIYRAKAIFNAKKIVIVTQKYHLYRSLYIANSLGIEAYGVGSDPRQYVGAAYRELREILARNKDFIKCIFKPKPTYLGDIIPVSGSGDVTNDKNVEEKGIKKQDVEKFIDIFYFMGDDIIIPDFDDINMVDEDWLWLAAYFNMVRAEQDPGMYVTKAQVEDSAKEIFGENLNKEFPTEGIEFWLEPEDGKYFVGRAGLDPDYVNDYEIIDVTTEENEIIVEIAEYKYNVLRDDNILEIMNIENNKTVAKLNREDYTKTDPELFHSTRLYDETIPGLVSDNIEQFSKAKLTLKMNEQTKKLYIVSLERSNEDNNEIANIPFDNEGDSAAWLEVESNYNVDNLMIKVGKYMRKIETEIAVLNESGTYTETMSLKEKVTEMYNSIKNNDFYKNDKYKVTGISIKNGNTESEEEYYNNSRAKKIKVTVNNDKEYE